jgi:hypothetical protein
MGVVIKNGGYCSSYGIAVRWISRGRDIRCTFVLSFGFSSTVNNVVRCAQVADVGVVCFSPNGTRDISARRDTRIE